jgi:hypothetical protein
MAAELKDYQCELIALRRRQEKGTGQHEQLAETSSFQAVP